MTVFPEAHMFTAGAGEPSLRWGVLAPGRIADAFVGALRAHTAQQPYAVASRSPEKAQAFAERHGFVKAMPSYDALVGDPEVDIVYIAAPQSEHLALGLLAIGAGKNVLIEKPLGMNADEGRRLVAAAKEAGVFLMEAMWSRYQPQASVIRRLVADGAFGEIARVVADLGHAVPADGSHRLYQRELGGGALFDMGIYPVQFASLVLGRPQGVFASGHLTSTGVDADSVAVLDYGRAHAVVSSSIRAATPTRAVISGALGALETSEHFHIPGSFTFTPADRSLEPAVWTDPTPLRGYDGLSWEATAAATYIGEGRTQSPLHTWDETIAILETLEAIRDAVHAGGRVVA